MKTSLVALTAGLILVARWTHAETPGAGLPPGEAQAKAALNSSPRHGEWVDVPLPGKATPLRCFVVYPEVKNKAPVVLVIHEIFGLTDWARAVADRLAADGFIAIAPDLLSGKGPGGGGTESIGSRDDVMKLIRELSPEEVALALDAARAYALKLSAANGKSACIGFCWGGAMSFQYATAQPELEAAVVYYGPNPAEPALLKRIRAPVLGFYGGDDARVVTTIEPAAAQMKKLGKSYTWQVYDGAGHGFLRAQDERNGANRKAAEQAWPATIAFLKKQLQ